MATDNRGQKALYNSFANIASNIIQLICGLVLPRLILSAFGSDYNGIISSISQFISVISLLRAGVGGATRASLYGSLARKNNNEISATVKATEIFMRRIALLFLGFIVVFSCVYPYFVRDEFDWFFTASLVFVVSLTTFIQYFFGITYQMLLQADQKQYVYLLFEGIAIVLNTVIASIAIRCGVNIHGVKLISALAHAITPLCLNVYVRKNYKLDKKIAPDFSSIRQRWDAFAHALAGFIHSNTDIMVLTIFSNTKLISVYTVYHLVANGLIRAVSTINTGIEAAFGNMLAKKEMDVLRQNVSLYELLLHFICSVLFGAAFVLITPFVTVYTKGITDINYQRYFFGYLVMIGQFLYCTRVPYEGLVNASGHFKQTKKYAFIEMVVNICLSLLLVVKYDLVGITIGTVVAILFRYLAFSIYVSKNILLTSIFPALKRLIVSLGSIGIIYLLSLLVPIPEMKGYLQWISYAVVITSLAILAVLFINFLIYPKLFVNLIKKLINIAKGSSKKF